MLGRGGVQKQVCEYVAYERRRGVPNVVLLPLSKGKAGRDKSALKRSIEMQAQVRRACHDTLVLSIIHAPGTIRKIGVDDLLIGAVPLALTKTPAGFTGRRAAEHGISNMGNSKIKYPESRGNRTRPTACVPPFFRSLSHPCYIS